MLPLAVGHGLVVIDQARGQCQQQAEGVLRHRWRAVALAVGHGDPQGSGGLKVDVVGAGGRYQNQLQVRAGSQGLGVEQRFVADGHTGALQTLDHIGWRGVCAQLQVAEAATQRVEVEIAQVQ